MDICAQTQRAFEAAVKGAGRGEAALAEALASTREHVLGCDACAAAYGAAHALLEGLPEQPDERRLATIFDDVAAELLVDDEPVVRERVARATRRRWKQPNDRQRERLADAAPSPADYMHIALLASAGLRHGPMSSLARLLRELTPYIEEHRPCLYMVEDSYRLMLCCGLLRDYPSDLVHCLAPTDLGGLIDIGAGLVGRPVTGLDGLLGDDTDAIVTELGLDWTIDCVVFLIDSSDTTSLTPETMALKRECAVTRRPFLDTYTSAVEFFGLLGGAAGAASSNSLPDVLREPLGYGGFPHKVLALIAHDAHKELLLEFVRENIDYLLRFARLIGPATTAALLNGALPHRVRSPDVAAASDRLVSALEEAGVAMPWVEALAHGREGGNLQISEAVAMGACDCVLLLEEPRPKSEYGVTHQLVERSARLSNHPDRLGETGRQMLLHDHRSAAVWAALWQRASPGGPVTLETAFRELFSVDLVLADGDWDSITLEAAWYVLSAIATSHAAGHATGDETRVTVACGSAMADVLGKIHEVALALCTRIAHHHERQATMVDACTSTYPVHARAIEQLARRRKLTLEAAPDNAALWSMGPVVVAPIIGRFGSGAHDVEATTSASVLAGAVGGKALALDANAFSTEAWRVPPELARHWATTDLAVITCADLDEQWFSSGRGSAVSLLPGMYDDLVAQRATGEIAGLYLDADGEEVQPADYRRHGMTLADLKRVASAGAGRAAIMVAGATADGGEHTPRSQTVRAALRAGVASVLVSDPAFATAVLLEEIRARSPRLGQPVATGPARARARPSGRSPRSM